MKLIDKDPKKVTRIELKDPGNKKSRSLTFEATDPIELINYARTIFKDEKRTVTVGVDPKTAEWQPKVTITAMDVTGSNRTNSKSMTVYFIDIDEIKDILIKNLDK